MLGPVREWSSDWRVCVQLCRHTPDVIDQGWLEGRPASQICERYTSACQLLTVYM